MKKLIACAALLALLILFGGCVQQQPQSSPQYVYLASKKKEAEKMSEKVLEYKQKIKLMIKELAYKYNYDIKTVDPLEIRNDLETYDKLYGEKAVKERRFYNIGAGCFRHKAWTNIDKESEWYKTAIRNNPNMITLDLFDLKSFPIKSKTAKVIYSSHLIEHITNEAVQKMLSESYRILEEGGIIRLVAPNKKLEYNAYRKKDWEFFFWINAHNAQIEMDRIKINKPFNQMSLEEIFLWGIAGSVCESCTEGSVERMTTEEIRKTFQERKLEEALDYCTNKCQIEIHKRNPGFHMNWFTEKKLAKMLKEAGFKTVYKSQYLQSYCPVLRNKYYFDQTNPQVSLFMEAKK